jgi:hypothetical protein
MQFRRGKHWSLLSSLAGAVRIRDRCPWAHRALFSVQYSIITWLISNLECYAFFLSPIQTNEENACRKTRQTSLQSMIPKDVMTSLLSLLTSYRRKICVQFWQNKTLSISACCGISIEKADEISRYAQNPSKSFHNKCHSVFFWDKN